MLSPEERQKWADLARQFAALELAGWRVVGVRAAASPGRQDVTVTIERIVPSTTATRHESTIGQEQSQARGEHHSS